MPPRLSRRQQREQEELEALASPSKTQDGENVSEDELDIRKIKGATSGVIGFAALAGANDNQEDDSMGENDELIHSTRTKKSKKKKKGSGNSATDTQQAVAKSTKGRLKTREDSKSKGKVKKANDDDFEKALAQLSEKHSASHPSMPKTALGPLSLFDVLNSLLSVSLKHLDPETELRRFFGSKIITSSATSRPQKVRSHLVRPQPTWPPPHYRAGLSMRAITSEEVVEKGTGVGSDHRERWWTFEASPRYKGTTYEYLQCVMGGDPQLFYNLMYGMPWHADTLLQMAEVFRHREEYSTAADFLSRALFAYERAFSSAFNLTAGIHRLDFDHVENRVFFLALARNVIDLNRRGTPRTAFEFARLLFTLEPHTDPHGALLHLDYLAIKARQIDWLLSVWDAYANLDLGKDGEARFNVTILPGWCWSRALALFDKEGQRHAEHTESSQALRDAILAFPGIAPLIADKIDLSVPPELLKMDAFKIIPEYNFYRDDHATSLVHLLSHIYAIRSFSLWKIPERAAWLFKTLNSLSPSSFTVSAPPHPRARIQSLFSQSNITDAIYRHVLVVSPLVPEFRRLMTFFPAEVTARLTQTIEGDPLPPVTAASTYEDAYFLEAAVETGRGGRGDIAGDRMGPEPQGWHIPVNLEQFQAMFEAHPEMIARLRGEGVDINQLAREFPQELMEAVMGRADQGDEDVDELLGEDGGIPAGGDSPVHEDIDRAREDGLGDDFTDPEGDRESEDGDEPFFPLRVMQNLFSRFWGRRAEMAENSDSDSEHADEGRGTASSRAGPGPDDVD